MTAAWAPAGGGWLRRPALRRTRQAIGRFAEHPGAVVSAAVLLGWLAVAAGSGLLSPYDPLATVAGARQPPSAQHWFGTDQLGRDIVARVLAGTRLSLLLGVAGVAIGALPGVAIGLVAGYQGGRVDAVAMRLVDALLACPGTLLALVLIAALGPGLGNVMIAVGLATIPQYALLTRSSVLAIKQQPYVEAARVIGCSPARVMLRHVLVNANAPLVVLTSLQVGNAILIGSGLSFLGLGAQPPTPEWGLMSAEGRDVLGRAWWVSTFPGLAILSVVVACNLVGDGLRAALDPKVRPS